MENKGTLEDVCDKVLNYLHPNCKKEMNGLQYTNAINSLKYIAQYQSEQLFKDDVIQTLEKGLELLLKKQDKNKYSEEDIKEAISFGFDKGFCSNSSNKVKNLGLSQQEWLNLIKKNKDGK